MRIAVQVLKEFRKKEFLEILESMVIYRSTLNNSEKAIFDVTHKEVVANARNAELDGMQMKSIDNALHFRARKVLKEGNIERYIHFRILAAKIRTKLVSYQNLYGPNIKKTTCAPTQAV